MRITSPVRQAKLLRRSSCSSAHYSGLHSRTSPKSKASVIMSSMPLPGLDTSLQACNLKRNLSPAELYELAVLYEKDSCIASNGALVAYSGAKSGRSPKDKRVVRHEASEENVWWGGESPNIPMSEGAYMQNRCIALAHLCTAPRVHIQDGYVNWGDEAQVKVRVICTRPYHALFMRNMMMRPTDQELEDFGEPDFTIYNAGTCPASKDVEGVTSETSVCINLEKREMVILGTEYAGEMKKGIFSVMHYLLPLKGILTLHSGCNMGKEGDVSLFFGLSGTGKTTLSADDNRPLIGDDEHGWGTEGVFNIEGGCYAKCIGLTAESEPHIWDAIKFGAVMENVVLDENRKIDYHNVSITENTRASYPIESVANAKVPCVGPHPKNIIMLCCDAFGVLPPVSKLTTEQAMYHFISGYTAKVAGTEMGITEPTATFSACFGGAFLTWHPIKYATMLAECMERHNADAWLVNTGWVGGAYGTGSRIKLKYTRAIIDAIHSGELAAAETVTLAPFNLKVPTEVTGVPDEILQPNLAWADQVAYNSQISHLAHLFQENMHTFKDATQHVCEKVQHAVLSAGPQVVPVGSDRTTTTRPSSAGNPGGNHMTSSGSNGCFTGIPNQAPRAASLTGVKTG